MSSELEAAVIVAAQAGDQQAQDRLVAESLPLVHNIVGRALHGHADVDDVAQESMLRVLSSLDGLREPGSFRSWLVTITMNQVRGHRRQDQAVPVDGGLEDAYDVADPRADFVDLTIMRLGLSGQRREVAEATRWLDDEDHEVLSLWWLEATDELTRAEVAAALGLSPQHTAVRIQRMKAQLETGRVVVRALSADHRCVLLELLVEQWDGMPSAPWRKRIALHARDCTVCSGSSAGLVPAERLLVGLALVPLATAFAPSGAPDFVDVSAGHEMSPGGGRAETRDALRRSRRARRRRAATVAATVAALVTAGGAVHLFTGEPEEDVMQPSVAAAAGAVLPLTVVTDSASLSASPSPSRSSESPKPSPTHSPSAHSPSAHLPSTLSPSTRPPEPSKPAPRASAAKPAPAPAPEAGGDRAAFVHQVTQLVNAERAKRGCAPVSANGRLVAAAQRHSEDMAARHYFSHTSPGGTDPGDRIDAAGYPWRTYGENIARGHQSPADVMNGWMNSPGHRANILNCAFREIGIGVHDASGGPWWTQAFGARS
ncbi:sigma-70 family RNA polymerase sigma factor [Streptomyces sp. NBC_01142]|uniref:sigma-70 family RNA polymerase sigma factor n=1 Tax=Streptomyces sp. NBC_01142 TaxID=2975865 RepID=UPI00225A10CA|nr:sigma-70 family RNA polymerase sigma factor [Streptomyces sp. NBC_01142]MCX4821153.1 sigma-70 family RNA polymerase sigma factor [Streptomyces sp. NBC_01142]